MDGYLTARKKKKWAVCKGERKKTHTYCLMLCCFLSSMNSVRHVVKGLRIYGFAHSSVVDMRRTLAFSMPQRPRCLSLGGQTQVKVLLIN